MSRFRFELARQEDDHALRRILAATPMEGRMLLRLEKEPSYFGAAVVEGRFRQVVVARESESGRPVGFGSRSITRRFLNGRPANVGYLSSLRLLPEYRGRSLVARGYAFFRELHGDNRAKLYVTTIAADNRQALSTIAAGRRRLPAYWDWGTYHTVAVALRGGAARRPGWPACQIRPATEGDWPALRGFLRREGMRRQFFVDYVAEDFGRADGMFRDLEPRNVLLAWRGSRVVGSLAGWNQSSFRQTWVDAYAETVRYGRLVYNAWARLRGRPRLPPAGAQLHYWTAALPLAQDNDPHIFAALLQAARRHLDRRRGEFLLVGMHERDPLLPVLKRAGGAEYVTRAFVVCWPDGNEQLHALDHRVPHLELGQL